MADTYVIDGYNLIHALGMIRRDAGPRGLEAARTQLLQFLAQSFGDNSSSVTVIFDAKHAPRGAVRDQVFHGMSVRFAPKEQSADDLIETIIQEHAAPRSLVVVSNDARLQNAAQRRLARAWSHEALLDFLEQRPVSKTSPDADEKSQGGSPEETRRWQREFADLKDDPSLREFFKHDQFDDP